MTSHFAIQIEATASRKANGARPAPVLNPCHTQKRTNRSDQQDPRYESGFEQVNNRYVCDNAIQDNNEARGSSKPRLPVEVSSPTEKFSLKPPFKSTGNRSPPSARIVTPDAPVNVVKNAHSSVAATANPPGIHPNSALKTRTRRSLARPSERMKPARVNSGIVGKIGDATIRYVSAGIAAIVTPLPQKSKRAAPPSKMKIGVPRPAATTSKISPGRTSCEA